MFDNGKDVTVQALGQTWTISRQQISALDNFVAWVRGQLSDPIARLEKIIHKLPPDVAMAEFRIAKKEAEDLDFLDWDSPQVQRFLPFGDATEQANKRGMAHFFLCLLQIHHPEASLDDAIGILREIGPAERDRIFSETAGKPRGNADSPAPQGRAKLIGAGSAVD